MPTSVYKYLAIAAAPILAAVAIGSYFYGVHTEKATYAAVILKQSKIDAKKVADVNQINTALASQNGALQQKIQALQNRLQHQPIKEHIVYVREHQKSVAVSGPVYVTLGAVSLFNTSFGLPGISGTSGSVDESASDLSSAVTVSDYENTTTQNAVACYYNQQTLGQLQEYVKALEKQGVISHRVIRP